MLYVYEKKKKKGGVILHSASAFRHTYSTLLFIFQNVDQNAVLKIIDCYLCFKEWICFAFKRCFCHGSGNEGAGAFPTGNEKKISLGPCDVRHRVDRFPNAASM